MLRCKALLQPLLQDIQSTPSGTNDPTILLRLHHLIKAVGNVAYGFPELKNTVNAPEGQWVLVFQEATRIILASLKIHNRVAIIREAVSFSHARYLAECFRKSADPVSLSVFGLVQEYSCSYRRICAATRWYADRLHGQRVDSFRTSGFLTFHRHAGASI